MNAQPPASRWTSTRVLHAQGLVGSVCVPTSTWPGGQRRCGEAGLGFPAVRWAGQHVPQSAPLAVRPGGQAWPQGPHRRGGRQRQELASVERRRRPTSEPARTPGRGAGWRAWGAGPGQRRGGTGWGPGRGGARAGRGQSGAGRGGARPGGPGRAEPLQAQAPEQVPPRLRQGGAHRRRWTPAHRTFTRAMRDLLSSLSGEDRPCHPGTPPGRPLQGSASRSHPAPRSRGTLAERRPPPPAVTGSGWSCDPDRPAGPRNGGPVGGGASRRAAPAGRRRGSPRGNPAAEAGGVWASSP